MATNREPVLKRCRSLQIDPSHLGIFKESKRAPQKNMKKMSEYGLQLREKQRAKFVYGVEEKQFRNTFNKAAKKPADHARKETGQRCLQNGTVPDKKRSQTAGCSQPLPGKR